MSEFRSLREDLVVKQSTSRSGKNADSAMPEAGAAGPSKLGGWGLD